MTVGFFLVDNGSSVARSCAEALTASVHTAMPGVQVVQLSDPTTSAVDGVDDVQRLPAQPMAALRLAHQAAVDGEWLFVDTDILIRRDVRDVFTSKDFEIAVTTRNWPHLSAAEGFTDRMPINAGVVFSRSQTFWQEAVTALAAATKLDQSFMGHQQVISDLATSGRFRVAQLNGAKYNLPPYVCDKHGEVDKSRAKMSRKLLAAASILHFKGPLRKALMLDQAGRVACA